MYLVIVGGGKVGYYLTKTLQREGYEVTLIDWNFDKVKQLKQDLGEAALFANGSSIDGLEKAGCARADVIIAVTGDDEDNLVVCQLGKRYFKVPKAIARINNPKNERVFKELGVGTSISGTISIVEAIDQYVVKQNIPKH
jgi:trk system potassium uptake protein TrkA